MENITFPGCFFFCVWVRREDNQELGATKAILGARCKVLLALETAGTLEASAGRETKLTFYR